MLYETERRPKRGAGARSASHWSELAGEFDEWEETVDAGDFGGVILCLASEAADRRGAAEGV